MARTVYNNPVFFFSHKRFGALLQGWCLELGGSKCIYHKFEVSC